MGLFLAYGRCWDFAIVFGSEVRQVGTGGVPRGGVFGGGEETVVQVPELGVCFDIGRSPHFALTSPIVCITHAHMDHVAGLAYYLSQRYFQGMTPGTVIVPKDLEGPVDRLLRCWRDVERQGTPYELIGLSPGEVHQVRRDFVIRAYATHHGGSSLGYGLISVREKLKPEYLSLPGPEIAKLRKGGVEVQYRVEVPQFVFLGDTTAGSVFDQSDVQKAEVLLTECTFFEPGHRTKAKAGKHLHLEQFVELFPKLLNKHIMLTHVSRRTGVKKGKRLLTRRLGEEAMKRIHFLMDLEGAREAGEVEDEGPPAAEGAE